MDVRSVCRDGGQHDPGVLQFGTSRSALLCKPITKQKGRRQQHFRGDMKHQKGIELCPHTPWLISGCIPSREEGCVCECACLRECTQTHTHTSAALCWSMTSEGRQGCFCVCVCVCTRRACGGLLQRLGTFTKSPPDDSWLIDSRPTSP